MRRSLLVLAAVMGCANASVDPREETGSGGAGGGGGAGGSAPQPAFDYRVPDAGPSGGVAAVGDGGGCNRLDVKFDKVIPTVALVVDRSSSMYDPYGAAGNRWEVLKKALLDPAGGLIKANEKEVRFGLAMYTSTSKAPTCPWLGEVDFMLGGYEAIRAVYSPALPPTVQEKGETPTGESIAAVAQKLDGYKESGPKYILLATDGEPDTCPGTCTGNCPAPDRPGWPRDPNCGQDRSITAVQAAFAKGIRTFVIGIGNDVGAEHLQALANAGAGLPVVLGQQGNWLQYTCGVQPGQLKGTYAQSAGMVAKYYKPADQAALTEALKAILVSVRSCKFTLKGMADVMYANQGVVALDGKPLVHGDANGWRLNSATELEVLGAACTELQTRAQTLNVAFPCTIFKPIE